MISSSWRFSNWLLADFRNRECSNSTSCFARLLRKKPWLYSQFRSNNEVISARPMVRGSRRDVCIDPRCCTVTGSDSSLSLQGTNHWLRPILGNLFRQLLSKVSFHSRNTIETQRKWKIISENSTKWSNITIFSTMNPLLSLKLYFTISWYFFNLNRFMIFISQERRRGFLVDRFA